MARKRAGAGSGSLIDIMLTMENDGLRTSAGSVVANCYSLLLGATATVPQIPNWVLLELAGTDVLERWSNQPLLWRTGIEEAIRWASPTSHSMRYATRDVVLGGRSIRSGEAVVAWLASANRDESQFQDAHQFMIDRKTNRHVSFGIGPHYCVGHNLARQAVRNIFETLFSCYKDIVPAGPAVMIRSNFIRGIKSLPIAGVRRTDSRGVAS